MISTKGALCDRHIVITGAASGIGRRTAERFVVEGAKVALWDRDADGLAATAEATGGLVCEVDVADEVSVASAAAMTLAGLGAIDGIVNAAGVMLRGSITDVDATRWRRVLDINLTGPYLVVRACLPWLSQATAATIVNVASGQGLLPNVGNRTAYAASKGGLVNLTRAMAAELAPGIRANTVCPGLVDTPMADGVRANVDNYALGRLALPDEIADAILFLTSSSSSYITGAALAVDGGRSFH